MWRCARRARPDRIGAFIGFDERRAHLVEGGADIFLMPSRYEPCGLNQMYSMRYGTVPVVRAVGGLVDTVRPYDADTDRAPDSCSATTTRRRCSTRCGGRSTTYRSAARLAAAAGQRHDEGLLLGAFGG